MTTTENGPATTSRLPEWLTAEGFRFEGNFGEFGGPHYSRGRILVVIDDEDYVSVGIFDRPQDAVKIRWASWSIKLDHAPLDVITRTITLARDTLRAAMIPED